MIARTTINAETNLNEESALQQVLDTNNDAPERGHGEDLQNSIFSVVFDCEDDGPQGQTGEEAITRIVDKEIQTYSVITVRLKRFTTSEILSWWKSNQKELPYLSKLVRGIYAIHGVSNTFGVDSELMNGECIIYKSSYRTISYSLVKSF